MRLKKAAIKFTTENLSSISSSCDRKKESADFPSLLTDIIDTFSSLSDSLMGDLRRYQKQSDKVSSVMKDFSSGTESE